MASVFPFNQIKKGGTVVAGPEAFIYGSGAVNYNGEDSANTTADGVIHNYRAALTPTANAELKGDYRHLDSAYPGNGKPWPELSKKLAFQQLDSRGATPVDVAEFDGIISVEYDAETNRSSLSMTGGEE
jgi:hypothetical protein